MKSRIVASVTLLALLMAPAIAQADASTDPDYANVYNPLGTTTHLLRDDDLLINVGVNQAYSDGHMITTVQTANMSNSKPTIGTYTSGDYTAMFNEGEPVVGRFFNTSTDGVAQLGSLTINGTPTPLSGTSMSLITSIGNPVNGVGTLQQTSIQTVPYGWNENTRSHMAVGDFNGDGYDDIVMVTSDVTGTGVGNDRLRIAHAFAVNDPIQGFLFSDEVILGTKYDIRSLAVGDFNGDGQPDVAVLYVDGTNTIQVAIFAVDTQFNVSQQATISLGTLSAAPSTSVPFELRTGDFVGGSHTQLVAVVPYGPSNNMKLNLFDFANGSYAPVLQSTLDLAQPADRVKVVTGHFDWSSAGDQMVVSLLSNARGSHSTLQLITVASDPMSLNVADTFSIDSIQLPPHVGNGFYQPLDMAVGNWDHQMPSPVDPTQTTRDPNLQLAVALGEYYQTVSNLPQYFEGGVQLLNLVDPQTGKLKFSTGSIIPLDVTERCGRITLQSADLSGRSLRLGAGTKIAIDRVSPSVVLAQPPSHIDWMTPLGGGTGPTVTNLTFAPTKFNAAYNASNSLTASNDSTKNTSWGFAGKESLGATLTFGSTSSAGVLQSGLKIGETLTATQDINHGVETRYGSSHTTSMDISRTTVDSDVVWWEDGMTYIYTYEVVGKKVCPGGATTCDDSAKVPLTVMFSAPGATDVQSLDGNDQPWFQPVWEPGNILSYPVTKSQLFIANPEYQAINAGIWTGTDSASTEISEKWTNTSGLGVSQSYSKVTVESSDTTVQGAKDVKVFNRGAALEVDAELDVARSDSLNELKTNTAEVTQSAGMTISKEVAFASYDQYGYQFESVVYGSTPPSGADNLDATDPNNPSAGLPAPTSPTTAYGALRSSYLVNPIQQGGTTAGAMWARNYAKPDIALNHPNRWSSANIRLTDSVPTNCIGVGGSTMDCVYQNERDATDPALDSFHDMRGFFIFKQGDANPADPAHQGMQQTLATDGDKLMLEARVYNYSLAPMAAGSKVVVNFYAMPWDSANSKPLLDGGLSYGLGQTSVDAISPVTTQDGVVNYRLASIPFDTTGFAGTTNPSQDYLFWVVAYGVNADGSAVDELSGKGISATPPFEVNTQVPEFSFANFASTLEPTVPNEWSASANTIGQPTSFSNNLGLYPQVFTVAQKPLLGAAPGQGKLSATSTSGVGIGKNTVKPGEQVELHLTLHNTAEALKGSKALFFDGDPDNGGKLVKMARIPYVAQNGDAKVRLQYVPKTCGDHTIFAQMSHEGETSAKTQAVDTLTVDCSSAPTTPTTPTTPSQPSGGDDGGCNAAGVPAAESWGLLIPFAGVLAALRRFLKKRA